MPGLQIFKHIYIYIYIYLIDLKICNPGILLIFYFYIYIYIYSLYIVSPCNEWFDNGKLKNLCYCNLQNVTCPYLNLPAECYMPILKFAGRMLQAHTEKYTVRYFPYIHE